MLLDGLNHVAVLTGDTDRLHTFYAEVFEATVAFDNKQEQLRFSISTGCPTAPASSRGAVRTSLWRAR